MLTMAIIILKNMLGLSAVENQGLSMKGVANEVVTQKNLCHES